MQQKSKTPLWKPFHNIDANLHFCIRIEKGSFIDTWMILLYNELLKKYSFSPKSFIPSSPKIAFGNSYKNQMKKKILNTVFSQVSRLFSPYRTK